MKTIIKKIISVFLLYCLFSLLLFSVVFAENIEASSPLPGSWFDDALFIGDSQTGALDIYNLTSGELGKAIIYHYNGLACHHIIRDNESFLFKGKYCTLEEMILLSESKNVYIMLAMNDVGTIPVDELSKCWEELVARVRNNCPGIMLFIQSATPVADYSVVLTKENTGEYNKMLKAVCENNDDICVYVDITDGMTDEEGYLKTEFQRDNIHLNSNGCAVWVENLYNKESYKISAEKKESIWGEK